MNPLSFNQLFYMSLLKIKASKGVTLTLFILDTDKLTLANSVYPDEMPFKGIFHRDLQCLLR